MLIHKSYLEEVNSKRPNDYFMNQNNKFVRQNYGSLFAEYNFMKSYYHLRRCNNSF